VCKSAQTLEKKRNAAREEFLLDRSLSCRFPPDKSPKKIIRGAPGSHPRSNFNFQRAAAAMFHAPDCDEASNRSDASALQHAAQLNGGIEKELLYSQCVSGCG
jgi:hypothetical protein